jgi:hypothetical protein
MDKQRPSAGRACTLHLYISRTGSTRRSRHCAAPILSWPPERPECAIRSTNAAASCSPASPPAALPGWLPDPGELPLANGPGVVEFTRGVVSQRWRGLGIYQLLMCAAVLHAGKTATTAIAAIEPFLHVRHFLLLLGFRECGRPLILYDGPGCRTLAQGMELDLTAARAVAAPHMATLRSRLQSKHIEVECGDQATSAALA